MRARARFLLFFSKSCIVFLLFSGFFHSHLWHFDGISSSLSFVFYSVSSLHFFRSFAVFFIYLHTIQFSSFTRHPLPPSLSLSPFPSPFFFRLLAGFLLSTDRYAGSRERESRGDCETEKGRKEEKNDDAKDAKQAVE